MQQASCLEGGPLLWIWPLYLHVNQKSDDDDDDDDVMKTVVWRGKFSVLWPQIAFYSSAGHGKMKILTIKTRKYLPNVNFKYRYPLIILQ